MYLIIYLLFFKGLVIQMQKDSQLKSFNRLKNIKSASNNFYWQTVILLPNK